MYDVKLKRKGLANNKEIWLIKRHGATHVVSRINFFHSSSVDWYLSLQAVHYTFPRDFYLVLH